MEKACSICQKIKTLDEFVNKKSIKKDGKASECKECKKERDREYRSRIEVKENKKEYDKLYYENNKDRLDDYRSDWRLQNKENKKEYDKKYREENKERKKEYRKAYWQIKGKEINEKRKLSPIYKNISKGYTLKKNYNITLDDYNKMLLEQDGKCWTCSKDVEEERNKVLCVDHDHLTGKVRKLLCNKCNIAIGLLKEDTKIIENVLNYIKLFS